MGGNKTRVEKDEQMSLNRSLKFMETTELERECKSKFVVETLTNAFAFWNEPQ